MCNLCEGYNDIGISNGMSNGISPKNFSLNYSVTTHMYYENGTMLFELFIKGEAVGLFNSEQEIDSYLTSYKRNENIDKILK